MEDAHVHLAKWLQVGREGALILGNGLIGAFYVTIGIYIHRIITTFRQVRTDDGRLAAVGRHIIHIVGVVGAVVPEAYIVFFCIFLGGEINRISVVLVGCHLEALHGIRTRFHCEGVAIHVGRRGGVVLVSIYPPFADGLVCAVAEADNGGCAIYGLAVVFPFAVYPYHFPLFGIILRCLPAQRGYTTFRHVSLRVLRRVVVAIYLCRSVRPRPLVTFVEVQNVVARLRVPFVKLPLAGLYRGRGRVSAVDKVGLDVVLGVAGLEVIPVLAVCCQRNHVLFKALIFPYHCNAFSGQELAVRRNLYVHVRRVGFRHIRVEADLCACNVGV